MSILLPTVHFFDFDGNLKNNQEVNIDWIPLRNFLACHPDDLNANSDRSSLRRSGKKLFKKKQKDYIVSGRNMAKKVPGKKGGGGNLSEWIV